MINPRGHNHQIALLQPQPNPSIVLAPDIKVPPTGENVSNLLVLVQVLVEEGLDFLLVARQQVGGDFDLVAVLVGALGGDLVDGVEVVREVIVGYAEGGEVGWVDGAAGVVREALVALVVVVVSRVDGGRCWSRVRTSRLSNQYAFILVSVLVGDCCVGYLNCRKGSPTVVSQVGWKHLC